MDIPIMVKTALQEIDQDAEIILFGSRARGDHSMESDWDFLILSRQGDSIQHRDKIREALYEIELISGQVITPIFEHPDSWIRLQQTSFFKEVRKDGVPV